VSRPRRLYLPRAAEVDTDEAGHPRAVAGVRIETVREEWLLEDGWWNSEPVRRRYFELVLSDGRDVVIFRDLVSGDWYEQRA
jgi:hypothetical protein